jgi:hypothetical protein
MLAQLLSGHNPIPSIPMFLLQVDMDMVPDTATNTLPARFSKMVRRVDTDTMPRKGGSIKGRLTEVVHIIHRVPADIITVDGIHPLQIMARRWG